MAITDTASGKSGFRSSQLPWEGEPPGSLALPADLDQVFPDPINHEAQWRRDAWACGERRFCEKALDEV